MTSTSTSTPCAVAEPIPTLHPSNSAPSSLSNTTNNNLTNNPNVPNNNQDVQICQLHAAANGQERQSWHGPTNGQSVRVDLTQTASQSSLFVTLGEDWYSRLEDFVYRTRLLLLRHICSWFPFFFLFSFFSIIMCASVSSTLHFNQRTFSYQSPYDVATHFPVSSPLPPNRQHLEDPLMYSTSSSSPLFRRRGQRRLVSYIDVSYMTKLWNSLNIKQFLGCWHPPHHFHAVNDGIPPVSLIHAPISNSSTMRHTYARLAREFLSPFKKSGISRELLIDRLLHRQGICGACVLIQVRNGRIYVYDPRGVRAAMAPFRALRLREGLAWIRSAVQRKVVDDFELILSTMDNPVTTCHKHNYRLPPPLQPRLTDEKVKRGREKLLSPIFNPVFCNISTNIPFPIMLSDALRRVLPHLKTHLQAYNMSTSLSQHHSFLNMWDSAMRIVANANSTLRPRWPQKKHKAVFRGSVRISASIKRASDFNSLCSIYGRTALYAQAKTHPNELDVELEGTCGSRIYVSNNRINAANMASFKYTIYAEGNAFWADRLLFMLFGSNAILKQSTPCGMFFEPLLKPFIHYLPIKQDFGDAAEAVKWARVHDGDVQEIVMNAREFAASYLTTAAVQTYVDELLKEYSSLLENRDFHVLKGAVRVL